MENVCIASNLHISSLGDYKEVSVYIGCVLAARPKVSHENLVFSHALKRQDRSSVLLLSMTWS